MEICFGECVQNTVKCADSRRRGGGGVKGHVPPRKNSCPKIDSSGFFELANYSTFVFNITINEKYH